MMMVAASGQVTLAIVLDRRRGAVVVDPERVEHGGDGPPGAQPLQVVAEHVEGLLHPVLGVLQDLLASSWLTVVGGSGSVGSVRDVLSQVAAIGEVAGAV